jgi:hypothetical protein
LILYLVIFDGGTHVTHVYGFRKYSFRS